MPNIAILNSCNLRCPYCFADNMIQEESKVMSLETYKKVLKLCANSPRERLGIIGGEPTLHPDFSNILIETSAYCSETGNHAVLFTNGINLGNFLGELSRDFFSILINLNSPKYTGEDNFKKIQDVLAYTHKKLNWAEKISIGVNIHHELDDYDFLYKTIEDFKIRKVRVSYVAPTYKDYNTNKLAYYMTAKRKFLTVCSEIYKRGAVVDLDCNYVPFCYLTESESEMLRRTLNPTATLSNRCEPVVDITTDLKVVACFGTYHPIDLNMFETITDARYYLQTTQNYTLAKHNDDGKCSQCKRFESLNCQGGCLAFAVPKLAEALE